MILVIKYLRQHRRAFEYVRKALELGKAEGVFPVHRDEPTGDEMVVVALLDGDPIGFVTTYMPKDDLTWIDLVWVDPAHRRKGLGSEMMRIAVLHARKVAPAVGLGTMTMNLPMQELVKKMGFTAEGIIFRSELA